ncbi:MAG: ABC-2 transporter permease [Clostridiales bacterium]|nr:ABC-2 transporter permease [Clostridiales bacterium]
MKGLLMKDLLNLKQTMRVWLLLLALFIVIGFAQQSPLYVGSMLTVMLLLLPVNALAYDENCKWEPYALTMPVTRRDLALSKYLLVLLGTAVMAPLSAVCSLMMGVEAQEVLSIIGLLLSVGLCMVSIMLPLLFRFGVQKGRMIMIVLVLLPVAVTAAFPGAFTAALPNGAGWLPLAAFVLLALSAAISVRVCERKEY